VKIRQLGSVVGTLDGHQNLTSFLIDDAIAIDAGALGYLSPLEEQRRVRHVFLSHSHLDHIGSLPIFLDNVFQPQADPPVIHATAEVFEVLKRDLFNDRVWPDLSRIAGEESAFFRYEELRHEGPVEIGDVRITPIPVEHIVPTCGFLIEKAVGGSALVVSDTGPTERIWEIANQHPDLQYVFLECSFPDAMEWLAIKTCHLSPALFAREVSKLRVPAEIIAVHLKTGFHERLTTELQGLGLPRLQIGGGDRVWETR